MNLTVLNGSPKKGKNNTEVLVNKFIEGFKESPGNTCETFKINKMKKINLVPEIIKKSECIIFAFPLYSYSMPSIVKEAFETLLPLCGKLEGKKTGFIVQFGFPEAVHARALEKYLEKLSVMLGVNYLGTVIKGGCNDLVNNEEKRNIKILDFIYKIGKAFGESSNFDKKLIDEFSKPEELSLFSKLFAKLFVKLANRFYRDKELKKNNVFKTSFARPYE